MNKLVTKIYLFLELLQHCTWSLCKTNDIIHYMLQKRLVPRKFSESMEVPTEPIGQRYTSHVTIPCYPPLVNIISFEAQQQLPDNYKPPLTTTL